MGLEIYILDYTEADAPELDGLTALAEGVLYPGERRTFARYRVEHKRHEFVAGRALLRWVLEHLHGLPPSELRIGERGKPFLDGPHPHFNLSNSHRGILLVISTDQEVGADLERVRSYNRGLEKRVLLPEERARICDEITFFRHWTAKEAYMKLVGKGFGISPTDLLYDPEQCRIHHMPDQDQAIIDQAVENGFVYSWSLRTSAEPVTRRVELSELLAAFE